MDRIISENTCKNSLKEILENLPGDFLPFRYEIEKCYLKNKMHGVLKLHYNHFFVQISWAYNKAAIVEKWLTSKNEKVEWQFIADKISAIYETFRDDIIVIAKLKENTEKSINRVLGENGFCAIKLNFIVSESPQIFIFKDVAIIRPKYYNSIVAFKEFFIDVYIPYYVDIEERTLLFTLSEYTKIWADSLEELKKKLLLYEIGG